MHIYVYFTTQLFLCIQYLNVQCIIMVVLPNVVDDLTKIVYRLPNAFTAIDLLVPKRCMDI